MGAGIVIIGAGHAGVQLAASLRQEGCDEAIALFSRETDLPYHKPPLSKSFLKEGVQKTLPLRDESFYGKNSIKLMLGESVDAIDLAQRQVSFGGSRLAFSKLVIATGARARWPNVAGAQYSNVLSLRTVSDARRMHDAIADVGNVTIIGGGFIGLELAATLSGMGRQVTLVEVADRLLGRAVSTAVSRHVLARLQAIGVRFRFNAGVASIDGSNGRAVSVTTTDDEILPTDLVVIGIGAEPDCRLAEAAGLACDNGVLVNSSLQTSHEDVFAIGDCSRFPYGAPGQSARLESVNNATEQAKLLARALAGHAANYEPVPWFWSDMGDLKLQIVGLTQTGARHHLAGDPASGAFSIFHYAGSRLLAVDSVNRPADHLLGRKMLAAGFSPRPEDVEGGEAARCFADYKNNQHETVGACGI